MARVADGLLLAGETAEALALLQEAGALARDIGERWSDPELDRLSGIAWLRQSGGLAELDRAETHFRRAVAGARGRGARLIELRAATSLAQLWIGQGRAAQAHALLAPIYAGFNEGFDTADLKEARALLTELA